MGVGDLDKPAIMGAGGEPTGRKLTAANKLTIEEMKKQVAKLQPPPARRMEEVFRKYIGKLREMGPDAREVPVDESDINWRSLIMALPMPLPTTVLGCGIRKVWLKEYECVYEGVHRFHVERLDGTFAAFNWKQAYKDMYHQYFKTYSKHDVELALRAAILPHLIAYKESQRELTSSRLGAGVPLSWDQAAVHHAPIGFQEILASFLDHVQMRIEDIAIEQNKDHGFVVADKLLEKEWVHFHALRAHYEILHVHEAMKHVKDL